MNLSLEYIEKAAYRMCARSRAPFLTKIISPPWLIACYCFHCAFLQLLSLVYNSSIISNCSHDTLHIACYGFRCAFLLLIFPWFTNSSIISNCSHDRAIVMAQGLNLVESNIHFECLLHAQRHVYTLVLASCKKINPRLMVQDNLALYIGFSLIRLARWY